MFRKLLSLIKNKFFITLVLFIAWMTFFDKNNIINQIEMRKNLHQYQKEKQFYLQQIAADSEATYDLMSDSTHLEKFARERYFMKKDSEDVFLMIKPEKVEKK
ncbi:MAG: septum formation initiator family protein [Bacteroidota bacterium]|nr:septum formation initiator family protein [Bacteroidota bacterium]